MSKSVIEQYTKENPQRNVAVVGLRDSDGRVLLMRSHKLPDFWQPIGGGIDPEDTSPKAAAIRELKEEFGVTLDPLLLNGVLTTPYDFGEGTVYFFEAAVDIDKLKFDIDPEEVIEHRWFSKEELADLPAMPATKKYLQQVAE